MALSMGLRSFWIATSFLRRGNHLLPDRGLENLGDQDAAIDLLLVLYYGNHDSGQGWYEESRYKPQIFCQGEGVDRHYVFRYALGG